MKNLHLGFCLSLFAFSAVAQNSPTRFCFPTQIAGKTNVGECVATFEQDYPCGGLNIQGGVAYSLVCGQVPGTYSLPPNQVGNSAADAQVNLLLLLGTSFNTTTTCTSISGQKYNFPCPNSQQTFSKTLCSFQLPNNVAAGPACSYASALTASIAAVVGLTLVTLGLL